MNPRDLVTLNINSKGGSQVVGDLNRISTAIRDLKKDNELLKDSINKKRGEISLANKEVNSYTSQITKQQKAIANASIQNEDYRKKIKELEAAGKTGGAQWQRYTDRINENINKMSAARSEITRLTASQTEAKKRLSDLQTQNKAYQTQLDKNRQAIADNQAAYNNTIRSLKTTELSYNQLSKRQSELRRELNNTSKSLNPKEWNSLNKQLVDVEKQMGKVAAGSQGVSNKFGNLGQTITKVLALMATYAVVRFFQELTMAAVNFVKEGIQMAAVAEGVRNAFNKLNQPNLLTNLRAETKGMVNDFLLMQSAVRADKFNIPVEQLGKLLKFAQQRAQETGDSVDYLVNSIIMGIGRKSSLILDNLGISATRLQKEVGEAGDFTKGVINIVNEELEKQGNLALTSAEKAQQSAAKWQNAQLMIGTSLKWVKDGISEMSGAVADAFVGLLDSSKATALTETFLNIKRAIVTLIGAIVTYTVITKAKVVANQLAVFWNTKLLQSTVALTIKEKLNTIAVGASTLATYAKGLAHDVLTKKITLSYAANEAFRMSLLRTPWGLVISLIAAIGIAIWQFSNKTKEATTTTKLLNDVLADAQKSISGEKAELELLLRVAKNDKISRDERVKAIKRLNEISPEYLGNLNLENINTLKATNSVRMYTDALLKNAKAKAIQGNVDKESQKRVDKEFAIMDAQNKIRELQNAKENDPKSLKATMADPVIAELNQQIVQYKKDIQEIDETLEKYMSLNDKIYETSNDSLEKSVPILELELKKEKEKLSILEAQQAARMYPAQTKSKTSNPFQPNNTFANKAELDLINMQVEAQRKLVAEKEQSLSLTQNTSSGNKDIIKDLEEQLEIKKQMPGGTAEQIRERNIAVKSIEDQIKYYKELGVEKAKDTGGKYISKQRKEMNTHLLNLENNYKEQLNALKTLKLNQQITEYQYNEQTIEADQKYYNARISYLNEFQKKVKETTVKGSSTMANIGKQMVDQFGTGNVDLLSRPLVDAAKLVEKGWKDAGEGIATVYSSQYGISDNNGKEVEILVTPILPNGDVLSQSELEYYVDNVLQGADDLLSADSKGLIISVGVDPDGKAGDNLHKLQEKYYDLKQALSNKPDSKLAEDISKDIIETNTKLIETSIKLDQSRLESISKAYDKEYEYAELNKNAQIRLLQEKNLSEEEYAAGLEFIDLVYAERRLAIQRQYGEDLATLEIQNGELKEKAVIESNEAIVQSEIDTYNKRKSIERSTRDTNISVRDQYGVSTANERKKREIKALNDLYAARKISTETHEKALQSIELKYEQERFQIRDQNNITSIWERYDAEKDILIQQREEGLLSEEEHQKALAQLKLKYATESAQNVATVTGHASDAVSALMQAETDNLDAEYDVRIAAAQGNSEEVERLETEKAQKKLDIEKKYADVQFAVRASEIIANTAVAIMQGYAQLGPIGGSIAAAFLGLTGAAQLASANAERQKVKNMTLKGSDSTSNSERFLLPGKEEGGDIDVTRSQDGKNYTASYQPSKRGYVSHPTVIVGEGPAGRSREWVASNGAVSNPTIRPIIDLIDQEQRKGTVRTVDMNHRIRQRMAGFETGGFLDTPQKTSATANSQPVVINNGTDPVISEMYKLLKQLRADGVQAIVGIDEIDARQNYKNSITQNYTRP
ncbi:hypothetical protein E2605_11885 [Dysgonomonas capnocytophagoides]|uniref:Phage tail tape measure protein n=1 Tax=Dysgonomonas capnocytophagoides TaxID=45254 RepID=A0A4Y8L3C1_9BACT|nr:hypothetical protein [Dysgonomonas capnocytophagoides]TFD95540.1 hypothetical protein E2605_11885 [Dysgonomonas capnocytophagoides]